MQKEISSSSSQNMSRMSQIAGLADMLSSSTPYSSIFFHSDSFNETTAMASLTRLMSQNNDLKSRFALCMSQLNKTCKEAETLRQENTNLRVANLELSHQISLLLDAASLQTTVAAGSFSSGDALESPSPTSVIENESGQKKEVDEAGRVSLPKSISVRSNGYLKMSPGDGMGSSGSSSEGKPKQKRGSGGSSKTRALSPVSGQKVYVGKKDGPIEVDVFNQGMVKTELCNKWQETGNCPYGDHCQFAHGIKELRPVIRHPRYKTQACRMVLAGDTCPYGHRCHFRHSLSPEEQLMLPLRLE